MKIQKFCFLPALIVFFLLSFSACVPILQNDTTVESPNVQQYTQDVSLAESRFFLQIPEPVTEDLVIELIDDVTGIELNPTRYSLQKIDDTHYGVIIPLRIGAVIKYRYYRSAGLPVYETNRENQVIDYRAAYIDGARDFSDILTNWADRQFAYEYGRLKGQIVNGSTNAPLPNLLVISAGIHVFTDSSGVFVIENLPPGKHNFVALSTDGEYQIFQQEAMIASLQTTPALLKVAPSDFVNVTFLAKVPSESIKEPLRIIGNTYQLGNVFGNVFNGESAIASRAPSLNRLPDGRYSITLNLPVGFNLIYKYTLGNGFWNTELTSEDQFLTRSIIIPNEDILIDDFISSFQSTNTFPIIFNIEVPENTPTADTISIQFFGYGWGSPIPLTKQETNTHTYTLYGPFNMIDQLKYRICRNDSCQVGDETQLSTVEISDWVVKKTNAEQTINVKVDSWPGLQVNAPATEIIATTINARPPGFVTAFQASDQYSVFQPIYSQAAFQTMREANANKVILPVVWTLQSLDPVILSPVVGRNPLWKDLIVLIKKAQSAGLQVVLTPKIDLTPAALAVLSQNELSASLNASLEEEYQRLITYVADLAQFTEVSAVALDSYYSLDESSSANSNLNYVFERSLNANLEIVKQKFKGELSASMRIENDRIDSNTVKDLNFLLVDATWDLGENGDDPNVFLTKFQEILSKNVADLHEKSEKPIIIRLNYPSITGAFNGCVPVDDHCLDFELVNQQGFNLQEMAGVNLTIQSQIYQAALSAINDIDWIQGVISSGYNLQIGVQDGSSSVRAKPAGDVLWYWFPRLTGVVE